MKQLLSLLRSDTEIVLRPGRFLGEYIIRGVRYIDDSNKVNAEFRFCLDMLQKDRFPEDEIWKGVRDEIWHGLALEELRFYERLMKNGGESDGDGNVQMQGMRTRDILPNDGGVEMSAVPAPCVLPRDDEELLCESDDSSLG